MNGTTIRQRMGVGDILGGHGAKRMGGNAEAAVRGQGREGGAALLDQTGKAIRVIAETDLPGAKAGLIAAAVLVLHRQQGQADAGLQGGGGDALGHFRERVIGHATGLVVQVVEFDVGGVTGFEHLHLHEGSDGLNLFWGELIQKAIHQLPPRPERIAGVGAAALGQAGHGALERVGMDVGGGRQQDADAVAGGRGVRRDRGDAAIGAKGDGDIACPSIGQQGMGGPERCHRDCSRLDRLLCLDILSKLNSGNQDECDVMLLRHATIATMTAGDPYGLIRDGAVLIEDGLVAWVGPGC